MDRKFEEQYPRRENDQIYDQRGRDKRLHEASINGNVNSLKQLIAEDPLALARSSITCFDETPLHVAAMLGHADFVKAVLNHKPDMAMAIDFQRRSPLHLASANGYTEIVIILLSCHPNACLVRDEDGRTPLHLAVMKGHVEVTRELVKARPEAATTEYKSDHGETALHSAVRHNRLEALKLLAESAVNEAEFISAKDDYGNTVLHTATTLKQLETVRYLLNRSRVEVNAVNGKGLTALDVIEIMPRDFKTVQIRELLSKAGALRSTDLNPTFNQKYDIALKIKGSQLDSADGNPPRARERASINMKTNTGDRETWLKNNREVLMVTAGVIAAMAYQAGLNPPSGIWQEQTNDHDAGTSIMSDYHPNGYRAFWISNTIAFVTSLSTIFLLVSGITMNRKVMMAILMVIMWITLTCMTIAYSISVMAISSYDEKFSIPVVIVSILIWFGLVGIVCLRHFFRFLLVRHERRSVKGKKDDRLEELEINNRHQLINEED